MRVLAILLLSGFIWLIPTFEAAAKPKEKGGVWRGDVIMGTYYYVVDTNARVCFAINTTGGMANVPCERLASTAEWRSVITWVSSADGPG